MFRYASTWPTAIALIRSGLVELDAMGTARYPLAETAEARESDRVLGNIKSIVEVATNGWSVSQ
jgi:L-iditol 2-dehydrogenase